MTASSLLVHLTAMRWSKRLALDSSESPWALRIAKARGDDGIAWDLTCSNPLAVGFTPQPEQWIGAYANAATTYAPDPHGLLSARTALSAYYARHDVHVAPDRLHLAASTTELYTSLLWATCDSGDAVLVPRPSYPLLEWIARLCDVHLQPYSLRYDGEWHVDAHEVAELLRQPQVKAVIAISPNNPTGQFLRHAEWQALDHACAERDALLLVDEVFAQDTWRPLPADRLRHVLSAVHDGAATTVTLSGLSKIAALPQLKLAWAAVAGRDAEALLSKLELIGDTFLSAATPTQAILGALLEAAQPTREALLERLAANDAALQRVCRDTAVTALHTEAGWSAMLRLPNVHTDDAWAERLLDAGILVQPGYFYDCEGGPFVVVSLLTPPRAFALGLTQLVRVVQAALPDQR